MEWVCERRRKKLEAACRDNSFKGSHSKRNEKMGWKQEKKISKSKMHCFHPFFFLRWAR